MGCCRGRARIGTSSVPECKELELAGSSFTLWPKVTNTGLVITIKTKVGFLDIASFLSSYPCNGPVASLLKRNIDRISNIDKHKLSPYIHTGISLGQILSFATK